MTEVRYTEKQPRVRSRQGSPIPRHQLGSLPATQRSYSRMSSKSGVFGDDSPLMSPLPFYPRHRSVTFAEDNVREERPHYNATFSASAPVSPARASRRVSPPPASILKVTSYPDVGEDLGAAMAPSQQPAAAAQVQSRPGRTSPAPVHRGRSTSRQRLAARRREAQLHHSFYDDSFVEDFVLSTKSDLEREAEQTRRLEREAAAAVAAEERAAGAEQQQSQLRAMAGVGVEGDRVNALQHAKDVLRAAALRRRASVTPSPTRGHGGRAAEEKEVDLLKDLEDDSDPDVRVALTELSRASARQRGGKHSLAQNKPRRRSIPIVSQDALLYSGNDDSNEDDDNDEMARSRKKAKLEKIVSNILSQQRKSKSKRSVVVFNWLDSDSSPRGDADDGAEDSDMDAIQPARRQQVRPMSRSRSGAARTDSRRKGPPTATSSTRRAPPSSTTAGRPSSVAPDLGDSLLFEDEDEQPILLQRRQRRRPVPTRSISFIPQEADAVLSEVEAEKVLRRAPRVARAPAHRPAPRARKATTHSSTTRGDTLTRAESEETAPATPVVAPARRRAPAPRAKAGAKVSADDPMAVFFDAAFPSPSKFDEMMMQAGGLPESRRGGGRGQPNLVLPSSIGRRR